MDANSEPSHRESDWVDSMCPRPVGVNTEFVAVPRPGLFGRSFASCSRAAVRLADEKFVGVKLFESLERDGAEGVDRDAGYDTGFE